MFDFANYTYSGVVSVLSTLFGLSYPLILTCIERIDEKYKSTRLTARFQSERIFRAFKVVLIVNLLMAVLFPFLMDGCMHVRYLIVVQCVAAVVMVYCAFRLFNKILVYYDAEKLQKQILDDYHTAVKGHDKEAEARYFTQWSDLTAVLLASADEKLVQSVYEEWYDYVVGKYNGRKNQPLELDDYFYDAVSRINENLCRGDRKPISVNNGNSILTSLILQDCYVTDKTYRYLWKNLRLQLFYGRDEWIMAYWKMASQKYDFYMRGISTFDRNDETGANYTEKQVEERKRQREAFMEFHLMLCAMLLQQGKHKMLEQMMFYTQSQPPSYPLVPSNLADVLRWFEYLNEERWWDITYYEARYPMPDMHGITDGKILGAANNYVALLVYRLYVLNYPYGRDFAFRTMGLPDNQAKLAKYKRDLDVLKYWLERITKDRDALNAVRITDLSNDIAEMEKAVGSPQQIIEKIKNEIEKKLNDLKEHQPNDPERVEKLEKEVNRLMLLMMAPYGDILGQKNGFEKCYQLTSAISQIYESTAFQANPEIGHGGIAECVFDGMWHTFSHLFGSAFYQERMQADYNVDSSVLFEAFDKMGVGESHYAIAFGINMDYYVSKVDGLVNEGNRMYIYKGMKIMLFDTPLSYFSKRIYITRIEDKPCLDFQEPIDDQKQKLNLKKFNEYELWMSVQKVEGNESNLSEEYLKKLGNDKNKYSLFHAIWYPKLYFKDEHDMVCLKVSYKMSDEGTPDSLDKIHPFETRVSKAEEKTNRD